MSATTSDLASPVRLRHRFSSLGNGEGVEDMSKDSDLDDTIAYADPKHSENLASSPPAAVASNGTALNRFLPVLLSWGLTIGLIFGGCCSNVFALEAIVKEEPESGLLITFMQFFVTFLFTLPAHVSVSNPPIFLKRRAVPLLRWAPAIFMFFAINMLNNFAFGFQISVPVHIILRSGGSVTTMLIGYLWGRRYEKGQVLGVAMLTAGVIVAAMADAQSKGKMDSTTDSSAASFLIGLAILFVAQLLSAIMGLYIQLTYARFGPHWNENLFYSHFLSLPLFAPFSPMLMGQFKHLMDSSPITVTFANPLQTLNPIPQSQEMRTLQFRIPTHIFNLVVNSLTQYACIWGVNLLGARTSALGVTIVLNIRKLVSLFISIWLFGNQLPIGVAAGAAIVFAGAGVYAGAGQAPQKAKRG